VEPVNDRTADPADITIDPELKSLIPPLTKDEREQLERNILEHGCLQPLVVWVRLVSPPRYHADRCKYCGETTPDDWVVEDDRWVCQECDHAPALAEYEQILLDGHNRYDICVEHGERFEVYECPLPMPAGGEATRDAYRTNGERIGSDMGYEEAVTFARARRPKYGVNVVE